MDVVASESHSTDLKLYLYRQYQEKSLCDVDILAYDGSAFSAHRVVVGACSEYLHKMFLKNRSLYTIRLDLPSVVLQVLLEFSYTGQLFLSEQIHYQIREAATFLEMYSVLDLLKSKTEQEEVMCFQEPVGITPDIAVPPLDEPVSETGSCTTQESVTHGLKNDNIAGSASFESENDSSTKHSTRSRTEDLASSSVKQPGKNSHATSHTHKRDLRSQSEAADDRQEKFSKINSKNIRPVRKSARIQVKNLRDDKNFRKQRGKAKLKTKFDNSSRKERRIELSSDKENGKKKSHEQETNSNVKRTITSKRKGSDKVLTVVRKKEKREKKPSPGKSRRTNKGKGAATNMNKNSNSRADLEMSDDNAKVFLPRLNSCKCKLCGLEFSAYVYCRQHMWKHHEMFSRLITAKYLLKRNLFRCFLYEGLVKTRDNNLYTCLTCNQTFVHYSLYRLHYIRFHFRSVKFRPNLLQYLSKHLKQVNSFRISDCERDKRRKGREHRESLLPKYLHNLDGTINTDSETRLASENLTTSSPDCQSIDKQMTGSSEGSTDTGLAPESAEQSAEQSAHSTDTSVLSLKSKANSISKGKKMASDDTFECSLCKKQLISQYSLFKHLRYAHQLKTDDARRQQFDVQHVLTCEVHTCQFTSHNLVDMQTHVNSQHPFIHHNCNQCKAHFQVRLLLRRHVAMSHGLRTISGKTHTCQECGKSFPKLQGLRRHQYWKHDIHHPSVKIYECSHPGCTYKTSASSSIKTHASKHKQDKPFTCEHCGMKLKTEISHKKHVDKMHLGKRPYLCQICGSSFGEEHELKSHFLSRHTADREFQCEYCPYATAVKGTFYTHLFNMHKVQAEEDKREIFKCPHCPFVSILHHRYKSHVNRHAGKREFQCNICQMAFSSSATMRSHYQWRHSEKVFSCTQCDYQTKTNQKLREHIRVQHQLKGFFPYKCPYCDFKCATGGNTRKHIKQVHKNFEVKYIKDDDMLTAARIAHASGHHSSLADIVNTSEEPAEQANKTDVGCQAITVGNMLEIVTNCT